MGSQSTKHDAKRHSDSAPVHHSVRGADARPWPRQGLGFPRSHRLSNASRLQVRGPLMQVLYKVTMTSRDGRGRPGARARPRWSLRGMRWHSQRATRTVGCTPAGRAPGSQPHLPLSESSGRTAFRSASAPSQLGFMPRNTQALVLFFFFNQTFLEPTHAPSSPSVNSLQCVYVYIQGCSLLHENRRTTQKARPGSSQSPPVLNNTRGKPPIPVCEITF